MAETVASFFGFIQTCFEQNRDKEYAARCGLPMMVYSEGGGLAVASTREELEDMVSGAWNALRSSTPRASLHIVAIALPGRNGFPVRIDWHLCDVQGNHVHTLEMRYFLSRDQQARLQVDMIEIYGPGCARTLSAPPEATI